MGLGRLLRRIWRFFRPQWTAMTQKQIADIDRAVAESMAKGSFTATPRPPSSSSSSSPQRNRNTTRDDKRPPVPRVPTADELWSLNTPSNMESIARTVAASSVRHAGPARSSHGDGASRSYTPPSVYGGSSTSRPYYQHHSSYYTPSVTPDPRLWSMGSSRRSRAPSVVSSAAGGGRRGGGHYGGGGRESRDSGYESMPMRKQWYYNQPPHSSSSPMPYYRSPSPQPPPMSSPSPYYCEYQPWGKYGHSAGYYARSPPPSSPLSYEQHLRGSPAPPHFLRSSRSKRSLASVGGGAMDMQYPAPSYLGADSRYPDARLVRPPATGGGDKDDGVEAGRPINAPF